MFMLGHYRNVIPRVYSWWTHIIMYGKIYFCHNTLAHGHLIITASCIIPSGRYILWISLMIELTSKCIVINECRGDV